MSGLRIADWRLQIGDLGIVIQDLGFKIYIRDQTSLDQTSEIRDAIC